METKQMKRHINKNLACHNIELMNWASNDAVKYICSADTSSVAKMNLTWSSLDSIGILYISQVRWDNLKYLSLYHDKIDIVGCKYLSRASMPNLNAINLGSNILESAGMSHLAKSRWLRLKQIWTSMNKFSCFTMSQFTRANWKQLEQIGMTQYKTTAAEILEIILSQIGPNYLILNSINHEYFEKEALRKAIKARFQQINFVLN